MKVSISKPWLVDLVVTVDFSKTAQRESAKKFQES